MKTNETQMVLTAVLGPRERRWVTARPQTIFKAHSFAYRGKPETFKLLDVMVGRNTQLSISSEHHGIPMEFFDANFTVESPRLTIETCQVGMDFKMLIENVSSRDASFECFVMGVEPAMNL